MKFDISVTRAVQEWLNTPEAERDIIKGADLMLSLNRNRALYNSIMRHPDKFTPKLVYELRKFLKMRLDNMAVADVVKMENDVMPRVALTVSAPPEPPIDAELPEAIIARGRRADHDSLPVEIRELWDSNAARHQHIVILFNELKSMGDCPPCDRYEKLAVLDALDKKYRTNLMAYDSYVIPAPMGDVPPAPLAPEPPVEEVVTDNSKTIGAARKTISKYRKQLSEMAPDDPRRTSALMKIQEAVNALKACGAGVADDTRAELTTLGIYFE